MSEYSISMTMTVGMYSAHSVSYAPAYDAFSNIGTWIAANQYLSTGSYVGSFNNTTSIITFNIGWAGSYVGWSAGLSYDESPPPWAARAQGFAELRWEIVHYESLRSGHKSFDFYIGDESAGED